MAAGNFDQCLAIVLKHEGGYVDHPRDPGGATNLGVTIGTLRAWRGRIVTKAEVRALTFSDVKPIYRKNYWDVVGGDSLTPGVDLAVFDPAVNSGPARAKQWYARARNADPVVTVRNICDIRMGFLRALGTWSTFGKGWTRRVADIRARGEAMARRALGQTPTQVREAATAEAERARADARKADQKSVAAGGGAAGSSAAVPVVSLDPAFLAVSAVVVTALVVLAFYFWHRERNDLAVKEAYQRVAAEVDA